MSEDTLKNEDLFTNLLLQMAADVEKKDSLGKSSDQIISDCTDAIKPLFDNLIPSVLEFS